MCIQRKAYGPLLMVAAMSVHAAEHVHVELQSHMLAYSETVSAYQFTHDWRGDYRAGQRAFAESDVTIVGQQGPWIARAGHKLDYQLRFTEDTALLYYLKENDISLPNNADFELDIQVNHLTRYYGSIGYQVAFNKGAYLRVYLNAIYGAAFTDGRLSGSAQTRDDDLEFAAEVDYFYSRDVLFDRRVDKPSAWGFGWDLEAHVPLGRRSVMRLEIQDLLAHIYWHEAPFTKATATSDTQQIDDSGHVTIQPTVQGLEGYDELHQRLPLAGSIAIDHRVDAQHRLSVSWHHKSLLNYYYFAGSRQLNCDWNLELGYHASLKAASLGLRWRQLNGALTSDKLNWREARVFGVSLGWVELF